MIGILAAIAIPSYQDYTARAQVAEGIALTSYHKIALAEYYANHDSFSGVSSAEFKEITNSGKYVERIDISTVSDGGVVIIATFKQTGVVAMIKGKDVRLASENGGRTWKCGYRIDDEEMVGTNQVPRKYMPGRCKD